jgi:hypothetical protein
VAVFSVEDRQRVHDRVLELAAEDDRVVAGAVVGSLADGGDRWSDLDLTFAVADGLPLAEVLDEWTRRLEAELGAIRLFDLPSGASIYRVFLLPGCLQLDLSFTPASAFGARGPRFRLVFGGRGEPTPSHARDPEELFGYAAHHALRARFCIERGRLWQAEYWVSGVRDYALSLACHSRGLPANEARGFDDLPADVRARFTAAIVSSLERDELLRALGAAVAGLLNEAGEARELAAKAEPELRALTASWTSDGQA